MCTVCVDDLVIPIGWTAISFHHLSGHARCSTSKEVFARLKARWLERGSPRDVDWEDLMQDIS